MKIERILAPNPGPFTGPGTNTWLVENDGWTVVIDPGPPDASHLNAIVDAVGDRRVAGILVTHSHIDHAPLANPLAKDLDVPCYGYGPGPDFSPDVLVGEGSRVLLGSTELEIVYTPGHSDDHLCFLAGKVLFTGDHIMGGSSVMVESMGPYLASLHKVRRLDIERLYPGHGEVMDDPYEVIDWYVAHRLERERQILEAINSGASTVSEIVEVVYREVDSSLHPLAARSVAAHLDKLVEEGAAAYEGKRVIVTEITA